MRLDVIELYRVCRTDRLKRADLIEDILPYFVQTAVKITPTKTSQIRIAGVSANSYLIAAGKFNRCIHNEWITRMKSTGYID